MNSASTNDFGTVSVSTTLVQGFGLRDANHSAAFFESSSLRAAAIPGMPAVFLAPLLKSAICSTKYATVSPVRFADCGWPSPDMRWQEPQAIAAPLP